MKKFLFLLLMLSAMLLPAGASLAEDGSLEGLPPLISEFLAGRGLKDCAEDYVRLNWTESPKGVYLDHLFVLTSQDGTHHDVWHFTNDQTDENAAQGWKFKACYDSLAPQGKGMVAFRRHTASDLEANDVSLYQDDQGFLIYRIDPDHEEYWMQGINVHVINHQFRVISWFDRSKAAMTEAYIRKGKLYFYDWDAERMLGHVNLYTSFGLNTAFRSLPKSYKEAKATFSDPPAIPGGTLTAERIQFTSNKKYAVYTGPGENYLRGGNGKASVSTNDWIQVFGRENGWIMIQYDITSEHMRIGWIPESALPKKAAVGNIGFGDHTAYAAAQCSLTDDPLFSGTAAANLPADAKVRRLAVMGDWVYVEYDNGTQPVRGFVRSGSLTHLTQEQVQSLAQTALLATGPAAEGKTVTADTLKRYTVTCGYSSASGQWNVRFDSGRDYGYTVLVEDKTGTAWLESADNG